MRFHFLHKWQPIATQVGTARLRIWREDAGRPVTLVYERCTECGATGTVTKDGWWRVNTDGLLEPVDVTDE